LVEKMTGEQAMTLIKRIARAVFYPMAHPPEMKRITEAHRQAAEEATERLQRRAAALKKLKVEG